MFPRFAQNHTFMHIEHNACRSMFVWAKIANFNNTATFFIAFTADDDVYASTSTSACGFHSPYLLARVAIFIACFIKRQKSQK